MATRSVAYYIVARQCLAASPFLGNISIIETVDIWDLADNLRIPDLESNANIGLKAVV